MSLSASSIYTYIIIFIYIFCFDTVMKKESINKCLLTRSLILLMFKQQPLLC